MRSTPAVTFRKFSSAEQAKEFAQTLNENGIRTLLAENSPQVDITFSGSTVNNQIEVKIAQADFDKANAILESLVEVNLEEVDKDHYLFSFNNDELWELLSKPDEWGAFDVQLAKQILLDKGELVNDDLIQEFKDKRLQTLSQGDRSSMLWIIIGYFLALLGGLLGITMGYFLWQQKRVLPDGTKVYTYVEEHRNHGRNMFFIGVTVLGIIIILGFMGYYVPRSGL